jgi:hypothetical protein
MPEHKFEITVNVPSDHPNADDPEWWADAAHGALTEYGAEPTYELASHTFAPGDRVQVRVSPELKGFRGATGTVLKVVVHVKLDVPTMKAEDDDEWVREYAPDALTKETRHA